LNRGTTISLYLVNGDPSGLICAYLSNWTGQSLKIPRNLLEEAKERPEINRIGIYFLFGYNVDNPEEKIVYIGEADHIYSRLVQHAKDEDKSFWTEAIAFSSKDDNLTKGHIKYLEHKLIAIAKNNNNYKVHNKNDATKSPLPETAISDMETYFDNIKVVLPVLGQNLLESVSHKTQKVHEALYYTLDIGGIKATGYQTNNGFVVKKGSRVSEGLSPSLANGYKNLRNSLIAKEVILDSQGSLSFVKDYEFSSPSAAAATIVGYPINGRICWKDGKGKTLKENEEAALGE
jgi:hypothetical protein